MDINQSRSNRPPIDIKLTTPLVCDSCQGEVFTEALMFRKVSALMTDNGKQGLLPVSVYACIKCNNVHRDFIPNELRKDLVIPKTVTIS